MKHSSGGEVTLRAAAAGRAVETATAKEVGVFAGKSTVQYTVRALPLALTNHQEDRHDRFSPPLTRIRLF